MGEDVQEAEAYNGFDMNLTHLPSLAFTSAVAAVPRRVVYAPLPDAPC